MSKTDDSILGQPTNKPCYLSGYIFDEKNCPNDKTLKNKCPEGSYYSLCACNKANFPFFAGNCTPENLTGNSCDEVDGKNGTTKYYSQCGCDSTTHPFTTANCSGGALSGTSCSGRFQTCTCPASFSKTCTDNYVPTDKNRQCNGKYESCSCDPNIFLSTCDSESELPTTGARSCTDNNGVKRYSSCRSKTCEDHGAITNYPGGNMVCENVSFSRGTYYKDLECYKNCVPDKRPTPDLVFRSVNTGPNMYALGIEGRFQSTSTYYDPKAIEGDVYLHIVGTVLHADGETYDYAQTIFFPKGTSEFSVKIISEPMPMPIKTFTMDHFWPESGEEYLFSQGTTMNYVDGMHY